MTQEGSNRGEEGTESRVPSTGLPERLGGKPRDNADDAYATFMDMPQSEWWGLITSLMNGGVLGGPEEEGFQRAVKERDFTHQGRRA